MSAPGEDAAEQQVPGLLHPAGSPSLLQQGCEPASRDLPPPNNPGGGGGGVPPSPTAPPPAASPCLRHTGVTKGGPPRSQTDPPLQPGWDRQRRPRALGGRGAQRSPLHRRGGRTGTTQNTARPASSQKKRAAKPPPQPRGGPLAHTKGRFPSPPQHPPPVTGGAAPLTSARRLPPLRLLHSAAAKPNNIPYSGSGVPTAPARGLRRPFLPGAPREM